MISTAQTIIVIFLLAVIGFNIWNSINLHYLVKRKQARDNLNDSKYWELHYKIQFQATIFTVILGIATYLGFNSIIDVKNLIKADLKSSIDSTKLSIDSTKGRIDSFKTALASLLDTANNVRDTISSSRIKLRNLQNELNIIKAKDILKQPIYIVNSITLSDITPTNDVRKHDRFGGLPIYFSKLKTISGNKLPVFKKAPSVLLFTDAYASISVRAVDTSFVSIDNLGSTSNSTRITLYISANE